jgi:hypothetical protein
MKTLPEIEYEFNRLSKTLSLSFSCRNKILFITNFLNSLLDRKDFLFSYALEVIPILDETINKCSFESTPLTFLKSIKTLLENLSLEWSSTTLRPYLEESLIHINNQIETINLLIQNKDKPLVPFITKRKKKIKSDKESCIHIPFVEKEMLIEDSSSNFGIVCRLTIEIQKRGKHVTEHDIDFANIIDNDEKSKEHFISLISIAIKLFEESASTEVIDKLFVRCRLTNSNIVSGDSLDAGFVIACFSNLFKLYDARTVFSTVSNLAFTGKLNNDGFLEPVDETGLIFKIEACAFSETTTLVVPKEQEEISIKYLEEITKDYDQKNLLKIIGIKELSEILYDRRILELRRVSLNQQIAKKMWRRRRPIAAALFLIMVLFIAKVIYGPIDKHPYEINYSGKYLNVKNQYFETLTSIVIDSVNVKQANDMMTKRGLKYSALCDVDKDGYVDLIYLEHDKDSGSFGTIVCKSIHLNKVLWQKYLSKRIDMPIAPVSNERFAFMQLEIGDFDKDGYEEIYILCLNGDDPCLVLKLVARTGQEIGSYLHIGHLQEMRILDLDNDGNCEILACGINQAYGSACLVVLDPKKINGHGPTFGRYIVNGWKEANEKEYILIPKTIAGKYYKTSAYNSANQIQINESEKNIKIDLNDTNLNFPEGTGLFYTITFNYHLKPLIVIPHDYYITLTKTLYNEGRIKTYPDQVYFDNYLKDIKRIK